MLECTLFPFYSVRVVGSQVPTLYSKINYKNQSRPRPMCVGSHD